MCVFKLIEKLKIIVTVFLIIIIDLIYASGNNPEPLSLDDAIKKAMQDNLDIKIMVEKLEEYKSKIIEEKAAAYPSLSLSATATEYQNPGFLNSKDFERFRKMIPNYKPEPQNIYDMKFNISQTIYTWGRIKSAIRISKIGLNLSKAQIESLKLMISQSIAITYYQCKFLTSQIKVIEKSIERQKSALEISKQLYESGIVPELDYLLNKTAYEILLPQKIQAENELKNSIRELNILMNEPLDKQWSFTDKLDIKEKINYVNIDLLYKLAIERNPDLKALKLNKKVYENYKKIVKSNLKPELRLNGSWGYNVADPSNFFKKDYQEWSIAGVISFKIFDGFRTKGQMKEVNSKIRGLVYQILKYEVELRKEIAQLIENIKMSLNLYEAQKLAYQTAKRAYELSIENHKEGLTTIIDVLRAEEKLTEAEKQLNFTIFNYLINLYRLKAKLGLMPEERINLKLEEVK